MYKLFTKKILNTMDNYVVLDPTVQPVQIRAEPLNKNVLDEFTLNKEVEDD